MILFLIVEVMLYLVFFADIKNYAHCKPISEPRGLPEDSEWLNEEVNDSQEYCFGYGNTIIKRKDSDSIKWDSFGFSWLTLKELLDFNYEQKFENRRISKNYYREDGSIHFVDGAFEAEIGDGNIETYREFLGSYFFQELDKMKALGEPENVRIIFWFH